MLTVSDKAVSRMLDGQGYAVLPNAIPPESLEPLRAAFEAGIVASADWPVPRAADWRHSRLDGDPRVQAVCRLPAVIDGIRHLLGGPFFLSQVEGREPLLGNAPQPLHRDGADSPGQVAAAMVWLDDHGAHNGATRIVPGSHRNMQAEDAIVIEGRAGDVLLFDPEVLHGATGNTSGARRRSLLLSYAAASLREQHRQTEALRNVTMDPSEIFV